MEHEQQELRKKAPESIFDLCAMKLATLLPRGFNQNEPDALQQARSVGKVARTRSP